MGWIYTMSVLIESVPINYIQKHKWIIIQCLACDQFFADLFYLIIYYSDSSSRSLS